LEVISGIPSAIDDDRDGSVSLPITTNCRWWRNQSPRNSLRLLLARRFGGGFSASKPAIEQEAVPNLLQILGFRALCPWQAPSACSRPPMSRPPSRPRFRARRLPILIIKHACKGTFTDACIICTNRCY